MSGRRIRVVSVVGTRPNFMKIAPIAAELERRRERFEHVLVHTGQHYDDAMSRVFLDELGIGAPGRELHVGSGSRAQQLARTIERLEPVLMELEPDVVVVPGDVNSTLAGALAADALGIPVAHIEAGLRSFDRTMPEEMNRILTDRLSALLFTHSPEAVINLAREGCDETAIHEVGNTMIDTLLRMRDVIETRDAPASLGLERGSYVVVTLHRPALVDSSLLSDVLVRLRRLATRYPLVFPVHPRTQARLAAAGFEPHSERLILTAPLGYLDFLGLVAASVGVVTDSGGVQEETTFLGIPCLTLRDSTERPVTVDLGTNIVLGLDPARLDDVPDLIEEIRSRSRVVPPGWDGRASVRVVDVLEASLAAPAETGALAVEGSAPTWAP